MTRNFQAQKGQCHPASPESGIGDLIALVNTDALSFVKLAAEEA